MADQSRLSFTPFSFLLDAADEAVRDLFTEYGKVELVSIPKNKETGQPRGFAFVDLSSDEEVEAAVAGLDGTSFEGRMLRVTKSVPKNQLEKRRETFREPEGYKKIYVGNIPFGKCSRRSTRYTSGAFD